MRDTQTDSTLIVESPYPIATCIERITAQTRPVTVQSPGTEFEVEEVKANQEYTVRCRFLKRTKTGSYPFGTVVVILKATGDTTRAEVLPVSIDRKDLYLIAVLSAITVPLMAALVLKGNPVLLLAVVVAVALVVAGVQLELGFHREVQAYPAALEYWLRGPGGATRDGG